MTPAQMDELAKKVVDLLLHSEDMPAPPDAADYNKPSGKTWTLTSHLFGTTVGVRSIRTLVSALLPRVADLQAKQAALAAKVDAIIAHQGSVKLETLPLSGTLTIGGQQ